MTLPNHKMPITLRELRAWHHRKQERAWKSYLSCRRNGNPDAAERYLRKHDFHVDCVRALNSVVSGNVNDDLPAYDARVAALHAEHQGTK